MNPDAERRILAEIEADLRASDPGLARRLDGGSPGTRTRYRRLASSVFFTLAAWLVMVSVVPVSIGAPWVKPVLVGASTVLLAGAWWIFTPAQRSLHPPRCHLHHHLHRHHHGRSPDS